MQQVLKDSDVPMNEVSLLIVVKVLSTDGTVEKHDDKSIRHSGFYDKKLIRLIIQLKEFKLKG
jgi:hypothetical protein